MDAKEGEEEAAATASTIPPRKLDCREEEEEAEESFAGIILDVSLHSAPLTGRKKPKLPELWRTFSVCAVEDRLVPSQHIQRSISHLQIFGGPEDGHMPARCVEATGFKLYSYVSPQF